MIGILEEVGLAPLLGEVENAVDAAALEHRLEQVHRRVARVLVLVQHAVQHAVRHLQQRAGAARRAVGNQPPQHLKPAFWRLATVWEKRQQPVQGGLAQRAVLLHPRAQHAHAIPHPPHPHFYTASTTLLLESPVSFISSGSSSAANSTACPFSAFTSASMH